MELDTSCNCYFDGCICIDEICTRKLSLEQRFLSKQKWEQITESIPIFINI